MPLRARCCAVAQPEPLWVPPQPVNAAALAVVEAHQPQRLAVHMRKCNNVVWLHSSNSNHVAWRRELVLLHTCHPGVAPPLATQCHRARPCHQPKPVRRLSIRCPTLLECRHSLTIAISRLPSSLDHPLSTVQEAASFGCRLAQARAKATGCRERGFMATRWPDSSQSMDNRLVVSHHLVLVIMEMAMSLTDMWPSLRNFLGYSTASSEQ